MPYLLIEKNDDLMRFCKDLQDEPFLTIDTEFIRERTFYPRLCLIQVAGSNAAAAIDPFGGLDLAPLLDLLANQNIVKVFHSARQDLEIFYNLCGKVLSPLFDTQIAAMVCGFGDSVSYESLVQRLLGKRLDKSMSASNWEARPLSERQLDYALADVVHLRDIYLKLAKLLDEKNRTSWIEEEVAALLNESNYAGDAENAWKRIRPESRDPLKLAILRELAIWREGFARSRDVPKSRIMKDETLAAIAAFAPREMADLNKMRFLNKGIIKEFGDHILTAADKARALPPEDRPTLDEHYILNRSEEDLLDMLRLFFKIKCREEEVAQKIVASADDLKLLARGKFAECKTMRGWRYEVFGRQAEEIISGKAGFMVKNGALKLLEI